MEEKENTMNINVTTFQQLIDNQAKLLRHNQVVHSCAKRHRAKKRQAAKTAKKVRVLRTNPKLNHYDIVVSNELKDISKLNIGEKMFEFKKKFRTINLYEGKEGQGPYIIQMKHNNCWIDWLDVKKIC